MGVGSLIAILKYRAMQLEKGVQMEGLGDLSKLFFVAVSYSKNDWNERQESSHSWHGPVQAASSELALIAARVKAGVYYDNHEKKFYANDFAERYMYHGSYDPADYNHTTVYESVKPFEQWLNENCVVAPNPIKPKTISEMSEQEFLAHLAEVASSDRGSYSAVADLINKRLESKQ